MNLTDEELLRYSRQILLENWDIDAQLRLKSSKVVILGAGGLGCPVSETLARAGVGAIHIIDNDVIEASNLQRQTLFTDKDVGQNKAETAYHALKRINPFVEVSFSAKRLDYTNAEELLLIKHSKQSGPFLLLDCTDNFATRELFNKMSVRHRLPLLSASAIGMTGQLALYEPAQQSGCYHCLFGTTILDSQNSDSQGSDSQGSDSQGSDSQGSDSQGSRSTGSATGSESSNDTQNCTNSGVLASTTTVMGNLQANAALQYLGLGNNPLAGQLLIWNGHNMTQQKIRYRQDKQCPVCAIHS